MAKAVKQDALAVYNERFAVLAKQSAKTAQSIGTEGSFLSLKSGQLSYQGAPIPGNKMTVVILDAVIENAHRAGDFDPDNPQPPDCYAFGRDKDEMRPHENVEKPYAENCIDCEMAQFGSAEKGKGPACGVGRQRLALITESDLEDIKAAQVAFLSLPYFSSKEYAGYVRQLDDVYHRPAFAFVTELSVVPDAKSQFRVKFEMRRDLVSEGVAPAVFDALFQRHEAVGKDISFPYPKAEVMEEQPIASKRRRAPVAPARRVAPAAPPQRRAALVAAAPQKRTALPPPAVPARAAAAVRKPKF